MSVSAQERPAILESVDLSIPIPPASLEVAGKAHLVYELHVTNFLTVDVAIRRVQAKGPGASDASLADYRDGELSRRIGRPGLRRDHASPELVGPGMRAVVYFWIALPEGAVVPEELGHRIELDALRPSGAVHTVVEAAASRVSRESPVLLDPPLRGGSWVAIYDPLMKGGHRTAIYTVGGRARIPGRFAIDWIRLPAEGALEAEGAPRPADWNGYGAEVLAVADGVVAAAMDDVPENAPPEDDAASPPMTLANASGNHVALDLGGGRFAFYEHLKRGSVVVRAGERVRSGQVIGRLGDSGSSSMGPHLHFHVSDANATLAAEGLPFVFKRFEHIGAYASIDALIAGERWLPAPEGAAGARTLERPGPNAVVRFE